MTASSRKSLAPQAQARDARIATVAALRLPGAWRVREKGPGDGARPPHDCWIEVGSLPLAFGTTAASIPAEVPYLRADPALAARWRRRIDREAGGRFRVWCGLVGLSRAPEPPLARPLPGPGATARVAPIAAR